MFVRSNEYVAAASLIFLHGNKIVDYDKHDIVTNIKFELITHSIKNKLFYLRIVAFVNKIKLSEMFFELMGL